MDRQRRGGPLTGGIIGLVELLDDDTIAGALESDLIKIGARLRWVGDGTDRITWRDIQVMIRYADPDSMLGRALDGRMTDWSFSQHLMAGIFDTTQAIVWQNSSGKGPRPKPLPRPTPHPTAHKPAEAENKKPKPTGDPFKDDESGVFIGEPTAIGDLNKWLGWT